ncbi:MAG: hypothetical protein Q4G64_04145 [bacterium]|nr:hypothetical protein [bacterium]
MSSARPPAPDPGMAVKMAPPGIPDLAAARRGEPVDAGPVRELIAFVDARHDCSDFRAASLVALLYCPPGALTEELREEIRRCLLGFAYRMDEPGTDAMCMFSENHQVLFAALEYLVGQAFPRERFSGGGTGEERRDSGRERLIRWLEDRFRFGYSEWNSSTYYEEDAAPLALLVDHAEDLDLAARAAVALDLLFLDLALYSFRGRALGPAGRAYELQKKWPEQADVDGLMAWAFPEARATEPEPFARGITAAAAADSTAPAGAERHNPALVGRLSDIVTTSTYRVPAAIAAIATDTTGRHLRTASGLDPAEVAAHYPNPHDPHTAGLQLWAMESFTLPESIDLTAKMLTEWRMENNAFLGPLAPFAKLRGTRSLPTLVRALNPATAGTALRRANITTYRSPSGTAQLSSVQGYDPGGFGDQQHLWTLALPGDVAVFATHPGAPMFDDPQRNFSPSEWVGNGINPALGQDGPVLLARYNTRARPGYLERSPRARHSHLFVPTDRLDAIERIPLSHGSELLALASGGGFAAILTTGPLEERPLEGGGTAFTQRGTVTDWAVVLAPGHTATIADLANWARGFRLVPDGPTLRLIGPRPDATDSEGIASVWELRSGGRLLRDGEPIPNQHPRFDTPWVRARRFPDELTITAGGHRLHLTPDGTREEDER